MRSEAFGNRTWLSFGLGGWLFLFWLSDKAQNIYIQNTLIILAVALVIIGVICFFEARLSKEYEREGTDLPFEYFKYRQAENSLVGFSFCFKKELWL